MPEVDRAPTDDDLLSDWAPRPGRHRGRRGSPEAGPAPSRNPSPARSGAAAGGAEGVLPSFGPSALRLVRADPAGRSLDGRLGVDETDLDENRPDAGRNWPDAGENWLDAGENWPDAGENDGGDEHAETDTETGTRTDNRDEGPADVDAGAGVDAEDRTPVRARAHRINGRWGRFAEVWVPESMREARVDPGRRGMLVLVLVAAIAAVVAAVGVWRDRPEPRPIETAVVAVASGQPAAPVSEAAASPAAAVGAAGTSGAVPSSVPAGSATAEILVSVTGLVTDPGVVRLAPEARVADAIAAAGGTQPGADLTGMNLAARLADGDSVVVTDTGAGGSTGGTGSTGAGGSTGGADATPAGGLVNLNTADEAALDTLPGVGPVMAQNILAWRQTNGRFATVEQLQEISGIGPSRFAQLAPLVTVG